MKCDFYVVGEFQGKEISMLGLYDGAFRFSPDKVYSGYMGVEVERIRLVPFVIELRRCGGRGFSVPLKYRDEASVDFDRASLLAKKYATNKGVDVIYDEARAVAAPPVFWLFQMVGDANGRVGGVVMIDRCDGHVWDGVEYEEYMHDFNGLI